MNHRNKTTSSNRIWPRPKKSHNEPRSSKGIWIRPAQTMKHRNIKTSSTNGWWISGTHTTKSAQNLAVRTRCESEQPKKPNRQTKTMNTSRLSIRGTQTTKLAPKWPMSSNGIWITATCWQPKLAFDNTDRSDRYALAVWPVRRCSWSGSSRSVWPVQVESEYN